MKIFHPLYQVVYHYRKENKDVYTTREFATLRDAICFINRFCTNWILPFSVNRLESVPDDVYE